MIEAERLFIHRLRVKNYLLLSRYLDLGRIQEAKQLQYIDKDVIATLQDAWTKQALYMAYTR